MPAEQRIIAHLSDPHIVAAGELCIGGVDTAAFLRAAIDTVQQLEQRPDLVLVSGDITNDGHDDQYAHARDLFAALDIPLRLVCGNHDVPDAMRRAFPDHTYLGTTGDVDYVVDDIEPLRIIVLDTHIPRRPDGRLTPAQLEWLDAHLDEAEAAGRTALVVLHHPPFATGIGHMDAMGLDAAACHALAEVVGRHANVERVLAGHLHRSISRRFDGTVAMTVPSCAHAVALDLQEGVAPGRWNFEPPAVTLHVWRADGGLVTHLRPIGAYPTRRFDGAG